MMTMTVFQITVILPLFYPVEDFATKYRSNLEQCFDNTEETKQLLCLNSFFDDVIQNGDDVIVALELAARFSKIRCCK